MKKDKILKGIIGITIFLFLITSILFPIFNLFLKAFVDKKGNYIGIANFKEYSFFTIICSYYDPWYSFDIFLW